MCQCCQCGHTWLLVCFFSKYDILYMGVSKNRGTPKWMVYIYIYIMEKPIKMDDLGVPLYLETPIYIYIKQIGQKQ